MSRQLQQTKMLYEIHITVDTKYAEQATTVAKELHWKTSEIARDPVLGNKNFFYLTKYSDTEDMALAYIKLCEVYLSASNVPLLRSKIEHIIYDKRYV